MNMKQIALTAASYIRTRMLGRIRSRDKLLRWQEQRIIRHIARVRSMSAFYRELWEGLSDEQWRSFPVIDKTSMMTHFGRLNTIGIHKEEAMDVALQAERTRDFRPEIGSVTVGLSSGTSGSRGLFLISERERLAWSGSVLAKLLPGALLRRERIAFFLRANSNLYQSVNQGRLQFVYFDLLAPVQELIAQMNAYRPTVVVAPPSMLRIIAESHRSGMMNVRPNRIISVAEVLDPLDRLYIEESFVRRVHQVYQCTEGFLAATCEHGTLHLNEDIVHIEKEIVDAELGKFVPIVTDFSRITQPIIRYRLNDLLTEKKEPCPCGSPYTAIESIDGRCDDLFYIPAAADPGRFIPIFPDFISRTVIRASEHIEEYEVEQLAADHIRISLRVESVYRQLIERTVEEMMQDLCRQAGCVPIQIDFAPYANERGDRKMRRVRRTVQTEKIPAPRGAGVGDK